MSWTNSVIGGGSGGSGVQSVTGLNTDNTDPQNPIVDISVDGTTITGDGTPLNPLVANSILTIGTTPISSGTVGRILFEGAGNLVQQSANLFWDNTNSRLGIGTSTPSSTIHSVGSITASGGNARGNYLQPTLVASANNNVLVALDIDTTFTNGAFTGVSNIPLRISSPSVSNALIYVDKYAFNNGWQLNLKNGTTTQTGTIFQSYALELSSGNSNANGLLIGKWGVGYSGGTQSVPVTLSVNGSVGIGISADAGFKLDVNGTARIAGNFTLNATNPTIQSTSALLILKSSYGIYIGTSGTNDVASFTNNAFGQNTSIVYPCTFGVANTLADSSSLIDMRSTTRGLLPPRMTNAQMLAISSPATGLQVYDTTNNKMCVYDGTSWQNLNVPYVLSVTGLDTDNTDPQNPVVNIKTDTTLSGAGTPASPLSGLAINSTTDAIPVKTGANSFGDSALEYSAINGLLRTVFSLSNRGLFIDFLNGFYRLLDGSSKMSVDWGLRQLLDSTEITSIDYQTRLLKDIASNNSVDWGGRILFDDSATGEALRYDCLDNKTSSTFYQNDFSVRVVIQNAIISNSATNQILWWSGHTVQGVLDAGVTAIGSLVVLIGGTWEYADCTASNPFSRNMMGIWVGGTQILLDGHIVATESGITSDFPVILNMSPSLIGFPLYGAIGTPKFDTNIPTTTNEVIRRLGHAYYENGIDTGYYLMFFRPSNDYFVVP
jgi:hypothetical protein